MFPPFVSFSDFAGTGFSPSNVAKIRAIGRADDGDVQTMANFRKSRIIDQYIQPYICLRSCQNQFLSRTPLLEERRVNGGMS